MFVPLTWLPLELWSVGSSSSYWFSTPLEAYRGSRGRLRLFQCHIVEDSGLNSGTSVDAVGHSGAGVVGQVGGGVEEVLVVVVVVEVVRSRYH